MPLVSIIAKLNDKAIYVGQTASLEEKICKKNNISFIGYPNNSNRFIGIINGYKYISKKLKSYKINAVIASGGYVSVPLCLYAIIHKIPLFLIEENLVLGSTNKLFYPFCKRIFLAYNIDNIKKKRMIVGMPIRKMVIDNYKETYDILVIGGSLGSKVLCEAAVSLSKKYKVCLIAGNYYNRYSSNDNLNVIEFSNNIYTLMKKAKLIIARAGASTTAEIFYINKPFICIPSMKTKGNHQYYNAKYFADLNACILCLEKDINKDLCSLVDNTINNEHIKANMLIAQEKLVNLNSIELIIKEIKESIK